ncbi:hypothetical protein DNTS_008225 [Danionella cerebrum]|uniref:Uncharacterized protein n=1 Tax=Danionella cerebrum TaxID=2873325 RepID=A0A553NGL3_9TELE|nr:hypothetical protein DNTS_008225 [Danionella translucida]
MKHAFVIQVRAIHPNCIPHSITASAAEKGHQQPNRSGIRFAPTINKLSVMEDLTLYLLCLSPARGSEVKRRRVLHLSLPFSQQQHEQREKGVRDQWQIRRREPRRGAKPRPVLHTPRTSAGTRQKGFLEPAAVLK